MSGTKGPLKKRIFVSLVSSVAIWILINITTSVFYSDVEILRVSSYSRPRKFIPRHNTKFEKRGKNYIYHYDPLGEDKARKQILEQVADRQRLIEQWHPHLVAKRGMLGLLEGEKEIIKSAATTNIDFIEECRKCAVVSNSDLLMGKKQGKIIDQADCVFRFGVSSTTGYEEDYGKKDTIQILRTDELKKLKKNKGTKSNLVVYNCKSDEECQNMQSSTNVFYFTKYGRLKAKLMYDEQNIIHGKDENSSYLSSIWYTLLILKQTKCQSTKLYGFPPLSFCSKYRSQFHKSEYWNGSSKSLCNGDEDRMLHNIPSSSERRILKKWAWHYKMDFHKPMW